MSPDNFTESARKLKLFDDSTMNRCVQIAVIIFLLLRFSDHRVSALFDSEHNVTILPGVVVDDLEFDYDGDETDAPRDASTGRHSNATLMNQLQGQNLCLVKPTRRWWWWRLGYYYRIRDFHYPHIRRLVFGWRHRYYYDCCPGWARNSEQDAGCLVPVCFGRKGVCSNGGTCTSPDYCSNCYPTHYSPRCDLCPQIQNCALTHCHHIPSAQETKICQTCMYNHAPRGEAFKLSADRKHCIETCSWRLEHNLCFPGKCDGYASECRCDPDFGPTPGARNCLRITSPPKVLTATMTMRLPADGNSSKNEAIVDFHRMQNSVDYINAKPGLNKKLELEWTVTGKFNPEITSPGARQHFIPPDGYRIGLIREYFTFTLSGHATYPAQSLGPFDANGLSQDSPKLAEQAFVGQLRQLPPTGWELRSGHSLRYAYTAHNGGHVTVANLDSHGARSKRYLTGQAFTQVGIFVFDFGAPYHCTLAGPAEGGRVCRHAFDQDMLRLSVSFTRQNNVTATFAGWRDDHSGVRSYEVEVMPMYRVGDRLNENHHGAAPARQTVELTGVSEDQRRNGGNRQYSVTFDLPPDTPAVYSVIITVRDAVKNEIKNIQRARRFFIYDNASTVSIRDARYPLRVDNSIFNDNHWWLQNRFDNVIFRWTDNFINELHSRNGFLFPIIQLPELYNRGYDQTTGPRSVHAIDNVHSIVHFSVQYGVDSNGGRSLLSPDTERWLPIADIHAQVQNFRIDWRDGESAKLWVRAQDVMGSSQVNSFVVHFDSTPAELGRLSLVNRGVDGLVVHHSRDLHSLRAQWTSSDTHSGLYTIKWEIFDNYTDPVVLLHSQYVGRQNFDSRESCTNASIRPEMCYCTAVTGCFNAFFSASPNTSANSEHNHDLFVKLTVTNSALLTISSIVKISIDLSAPHPGHAFDGPPESDEEVDFQNDRLLRAHWSGFFDPESGIRMFRYGFSTTCQAEAQLRLETKDLEASWEAPGTGRYYFTVVAYNNAMEPSAAVCSDGVLVTDKKPSIGQLGIASLRVRPGLLLDAKTNELWYLTGNGRRRALRNDNATCRARATLTPDSNLLAFDLSKFNLSVIQTYEDADCEDIGPAGTAFYLVSDNSLDLTWEAADSVSGIRHSSIVLTDGPSSEAATLAGPFITKRSSESLRNLPLEDGRRLFVTVTAVNRAGLTDSLTLGPVTVDTSPPRFSGRLRARTDGQLLLIAWSEGDFRDPESDSLAFEIGVGSRDNSADIVAYRPAAASTPECNHTDASAITCAALPLRGLDWYLIGGHTYYVSVRGTNGARLSTTVFAEPITHTNRLPTGGIVADEDPVVDPESMFGVPHDIRYQLRDDSLRSRWFGFQYADSFQVFVLNEQGGIIAASASLPREQRRYQFYGLKLDVLKTYFTRVTATSSLGSVSAVSSGVTVESHSARLNLLPLNLLPPFANGTKPGQGRDFQSSISTLSVRWRKPESPLDVLFHTAYWSLQMKLTDIADWRTIESFKRVAFTNESIILTNLHLIDGSTYRSLVKLCSDRVCSQAEATPEFVVLHTAPRPSNWRVNLASDNQTVNLTIEDFKQWPKPVSDAISHYQWSLQHNGANILNWTDLDFEPGGTGFKTISIKLSWPLRSTKCLHFAVKCLNRAGLAVVDRRQLRDCSAYDPKLINDPILMDALGPVSLGKHESWTLQDVDYVNASAQLAAVWPELRYTRYEWALLASAGGTGGSGYYDRVLLEPPQSPGSHADAVAGGFTNDEFVNVPQDLRLQLGRRYHLCIHVNETLLQFEKFTQLLPEFSECTDGVTVLGEAAGQGRIALNGRYEDQMVTSLSDILIEWSGFATNGQSWGDLPHVTEISDYAYCLGSFASGCDVISWSSVGDVQNVQLTGLAGKLQEGHMYFVSVKGTDFIGRVVFSQPRSFRVVLHPPRVNPSALITFGGRHRSISAHNIGQEVCWNGRFIDDVAGVRRYWVALGSSPDRPDAVPFVESPDACHFWSSEELLSLRDGHHYWVLLRAENFAGLISDDHSAPILVDRSPPLGGEVLDLDPARAVELGAWDCNYRFSVDGGLAASWSDFHDPHSPVTDFWVAVGSCRQCQDLMPFLQVGARQNFSIDHLDLQTGQRYFLTVRGCNAADLCSEVSSDGVIIDVTPPLAGTVLVGSSDDHKEFLPPSEVFEFSLYGFSDPESGIAFYRWGIASLNASSPDKINWTAMAETDFLSCRLQLPEQTWLKVLVETVNNAGLSTLSESSAFLIDDSPPEIDAALEVSNVFGQLEPDWLILDDVVTVMWNVSDSESSIKNHWISMSYHATGRITFEPVKIPGLLTNFTFHDLDLKDGGNYTVHLVSCNRAGICIRQSVAVAVDTSPPVTGHLAVATDSAVKLGWHIEDGLSWKQNEVNLSWLGFQDPHSDIDRYSLYIGTSWFGSELLSEVEVKHSTEIGQLQQVPDVYAEIVEEPSVNTVNLKASDAQEGPLQTATFELKQSLLAGMSFFVHLVAINKAGLYSQPVHATLTVLDTGSLWLQRRCPGASTCIGHCTCAPQHQVCRPDSSSACRPVKPADSVDHDVEVLDIVSFEKNNATLPRFGVKTTPTRSMLAAAWRIRKTTGRPPIRYEVSVGLAEFDEPRGLLDSAHERVWLDVGLRTQAAVNITASRRLNEHVAYRVFLRAWFDVSTYVIFHSHGVTVNSKPPSVYTRLGAGVKDLLTLNSRRDTDFVNRADIAVIGWRNKFFTSKEAPALSYRVSLGSEPGMNDVADTVVSSNKTAHRFEELNLRPGRRYFSTVTAVDENGLTTSVSSDGFVVDLESPQAGVAYNQMSLTNARYSKDFKKLSSSWQGFFDRESYIRSYETCVSSSRERGACDVLEWRNVDFQQSAIVEGSWRHGQEYFHRVRAFDAANRTSETIISPGIILDATPPVAIERLGLKRVALRNPNFEEQALKLRNSSASGITHANLVDLLKVNVSIPHWTLEEGQAIAVQVGPGLAAEGESALMLFGRVAQSVRTGQNRRYRLQLFAAALPVLDPLSAMAGGLISAPGLRRAFRLFDDDSKKSQGSLVHWQRQVFYFTASSTESKISVESLSYHTGLAIDSVSIHLIDTESSAKNFTDNPIHVDTVAARDSGFVHASWDLLDLESGIGSVHWAIGTVRGGTQLLPFTYLGPAAEAQAEVGLTHGSNVHVSVLAVNGAGLTRMFHSQPRLVDLTPPVIDFVLDDGLMGLRESAAELTVKFAASDPESGLTGGCYWCCGSAPGACNLAAYERIPDGQFTATRTMAKPENLIGQRVISTVRCGNAAGLWAVRVSLGVLIYNGTPDAREAKLSVYSPVVSPFQPIGNFVGSSSEFLFSWRGFKDQIELAGYEIRLLDVEQHRVARDWLSAVGSTVQAVHLSRLSLGSGKRYRVEVRAVNLLGKRSETASQEFRVDAEPPALTGKRWQVSFNPDRRQLKIDWLGVFESSSALTFEVNVETAPSKGDVYKWYATNQHSLVLKAIDPSQQRLFMRITAVNEAGLANFIYQEIIV